MENILNKSYVRKNVPDSDTFIVDSVEGEFVVFTNGARCKYETLITDFQEFGTIAINESIEINPDTFFDTPINENDPLLSQMEQIANNPNVSITSDKLATSVSLDDVKPNGLNITPNPTPNITHNINTNHAPQQTDEIRLPEWDVFDRVKRIEEIEINIPFKIKLPKAQKIDALNDMFETSFIAYLAKQFIIENLTTNKSMLQLTIKEAIEEWVDEQVYGTPKKPAKKPAKKTTAKKNVIKPEVVETVAVEPDDKPIEVTSLDFFNMGEKNSWDGDISKLFVINTSTQLEAVKKQFLHLQHHNLNPNEMERLQDMIVLYEDNLKYTNNKI